MSRAKFPPPNEHVGDEIFLKYWKAYLGSITTRDNFQKFHLLQLAVLCRAHKEEELLFADVQKHGHSYGTNGGRNGDQYRPRPETQQLRSARSEIIHYIKVLGLAPSKQNGPQRDKEADEWNE